MIRKTFALIAALLVVALTGCTTTEYVPVPAEPTSEAAEAAPEPEPTTEAPEPEPEPVEDDRTPFTGDLSYEESMLILEMAMDSLSPSEFSDTCDAYLILGSDIAYAEFSGGFADAGSTVDRQAFDDFFNTQC